LLLLVFSSSESELSSKAFAILENAQPDLVSAMLSEQRFNRIACQFLAKLNPEPLLLSRLCSITISALIIQPNSIIDTCGFILQFLSYSDHVSVFSLYEMLCKNNESSIGIQNWLIDVGFPELLYKEIESTENVALETRDFDELLISYFSIVKISTTSRVLTNHFKTREYVSILNMFIGEYPIRVECYRWEALSFIISNSTMESMRGVFQSAIELLTNRLYSPTLAGFSCVKILSFMLDKDPELTQFFNMFNVPRIIGNLIILYQDHSSLHNVCREFFGICLRNQIMFDQALNNLIPIVMGGIFSSSRTLVSTATRLLLVLSQLIEDDESIYNKVNSVPGFISISQQFLSQYHQVMDSDFGMQTSFVYSDNASELAENTLKYIRSW